MYDYQDYQTNIEHYGQADPPLIPLEKLKNALENINILLIQGTADNLVSPPDFEITKSFMPSTAKYGSLNDYNHMDMLWANDAHLEMHPLILNFTRDNINN